MNARGRTAGILGAIAGLAAAGTATGVAVERTAASRLRRRPDALADEPYGLLPADEVVSVTTIDGVRLHTEIVGRGYTQKGAKGDEQKSAKGDKQKCAKGDEQKGAKGDEQKGAKGDEQKGAKGDEQKSAKGDEELTVVFVHGYCLDMGIWHFQRRALAGMSDPSSRLVFFDQRGHGRSDRADPQTYTIDQLGRDLDEVLAAVAPDGPLVLVGHSMGGMAVMALAEQRPDLIVERVVGVALMSTSSGELDAVTLGFPKMVSWLRRPLTPLVTGAARHRAGWIERARTAGHDVTWLVTRHWSFGSADVSPSLVSYVERMNSSTPIETVAGFLATLSDHHRTDALPVLDGIETLVLVGDSDLMTPPEHSRRLAAALPGCELEEIEDGGHLALMEHPEEVDDLLRFFLRRAARAIPDRKAAR